MTVSTPVILGIDPGTAITGWGVVTERQGVLQALGFGVIRTPSTELLSARLVTIYDELSALLKKWHI